eukprot:scaffold2232_cov146-Skeletonema_dohrnii-CCMP3373.AAC.2
MYRPSQRNNGLELRWCCVAACRIGRANCGGSCEQNGSVGILRVVAFWSTDSYGTLNGSVQSKNAKKAQKGHGVGSTYARYRRQCSTLAIQSLYSKHL